VAPKLSPCSQFAASSSGNEVVEASTTQRTTPASPPSIRIVVGRSRSKLLRATKNTTISASTPSAHSTAARSWPMPCAFQCTVDRL